MPVQRDDAVLPWTRRASIIVVCALVPALIVLWGLPTRTDDLWAWTIAAPLTPIFLGSGYGAGAYFFVRVAMLKKWHPASAGVLSAAFFAALMLMTTIIHWDKFNQGHAPALAATAFYLWTAIYILSPPLIGWLWVANHRHDPGPQTGDTVVPLRVGRGDIIAVTVGPGTLVPARVRTGAAVFAGIALVAGFVLLIAPSVGVDNWGWPLTPLTARVIGCFTCQVGLGALLLSRDSRWTAWRLLIQTFFVAVGLLLVGAIRFWGDFDHDNVMSWLYVGGLAATTVALFALYRRMEATA